MGEPPNVRNVLFVIAICLVSFAVAQWGKWWYATIGTSFLLLIYVGFSLWPLVKGCIPPMHYEPRYPAPPDGWKAPPNSLVSTTPPVERRRLSPEESNQHKEPNLLMIS